MKNAPFMLESTPTRKEVMLRLMDPLDWVYLALLILAFILSAFCSATETAFACLNKYRFKVQADEGNKTAKLIVWLYDHFDSTLITVVIGNNIASIGLSVISTTLCLKWMGGFVDGNLLSLLVSLVMGFLCFLFGDTLPKYVGKGAPNAVVKITVYPLTFFYGLFYPLGLVFRGITWLVKKLFRAKPTPSVTEADFASAVEEAEDQGELESNESDIIQATLDFDDTSVREVLTPKSRMVMIDLKGITNEKLIEIIKQTRFSRLPCYVSNKNQIVGVLVVKSFLTAYFKNPKVNCLSMLQKPYFVSPSVKLDDLIAGFRDRKTQIAIVKKDNDVLGMVTMEDCLEELVGKIAEPTKESV